MAMNKNLQNLPIEMFNVKTGEAPTFMKEIFSINDNMKVGQHQLNVKNRKIYFILQIHYYAEFNADFKYVLVFFISSINFTHRCAKYDHEERHFEKPLVLLPLPSHPKRANISFDFISPI